MTTRADAHKPDFHRDSAYPQPVRAATTANITIATALNNGDSLDGLTLATGDRVLVKDQSTGAENGIYIVGVTPVRADDMDTGLEAWGAIIKVQAGTVNAGTLWTNTNATLPTIGSTALTFASIGGGAPTGAAGGDLSGTYPNPSVVDDSHAHTASTITGVIETGDAAGGDLSGTYPNPSVVNDSHTHTAATLPTASGGQILISDTPSTPLVFADLIQNEAQDDLVYAD